MSKTLVLNASYEAIAVVPLRRAVVLVLAEKAEIVAEGDGSLHSETMALPVPEVIRLTRFVRIPYRRGAQLTRRGVLAREGFRCGYCGGKADTIDHIIPRAQGGVHKWENVVAACRSCNFKKRDRTPLEASMALKVTPTVPQGTVALIVGVGHMRPMWEPYLL